MSTAFKNNRKARRRQRDSLDPERRRVRNLIKRGKAPRLTIAQNAKGKIPQRGTYRRRLTPVGDKVEEAKAAAMGWRPKYKRVAVLRMNNFIRYTFGAIFANKAGK